MQGISPPPEPFRKCRISPHARIKLIVMREVSLRLLVGLVFGGLCVSCEEAESPILFDTESNSNPENVRCEYYSPDPSCGGENVMDNSL